MAQAITMRVAHTAIAVAAAVVVGHQAQAQSTKFDFSYRSTDNQFQVFDDGRSTKIQVPEGTALPTIVGIEPKGEVLLIPKRDATYLVLDGLHQRLSLRWAGRRDVNILYMGAAAPESRVAAAAAFGAATPVANYGAAARPAMLVGGTSVVTPTEQGRMPAAQAVPPLPTLTPELVQALVTALSQAAPAAAPAPVAPVVTAHAAPVVAVAALSTGLAGMSEAKTEQIQKAAQTPIATPVAPEVPVIKLSRFTFNASDKTVEGTFARWALESKLNKKIVWRVNAKPPLDALGDFEAKDIFEAMSTVAAAFENSSNPFVVKEYDNVILVVSSISERLQSK